MDRVWELPHEEVVMRRRVLASTALTCRTFMEPALDRLWRSLDKLFPLFKLLPAFYRSDLTFVSGVIFLKELLVIYINVEIRC